MTFNDLQSSVADRYNRTSPDALARIGISINEGYKIITRRCGINTIGRGDRTVTTTPGIRDLVVGPNVDKVLAVFNPALSPTFQLGEVSYETLKAATVLSDPPEQYAIKEMGASTVTLFLGSVVATAFPLTCSCRINVTTLSGIMEPRFSENFHDLLLNYAAAVELRKNEKEDLAVKQDTIFEKRLSELVYYNAISAYKDIMQGGSSSILNPDLVPLE